MELVIATVNLHKVREYRDLLKSFKNFDIRSLSNSSESNAHESAANTLEEKARQKAKKALKEFNCVVIADETILVVPALQSSFGAVPGLQSRRYAGEDATDAENRKKLLKEMAHLQSHQRTAYFECFITLLTPTGLSKTAFTTTYGSISLEEKGRNGFGYDSLFIKQDYDKTYAEMSDETKNRISHRGKAVEKLIPFLEQVHAQAKNLTPFPCTT